MASGTGGAAMIRRNSVGNSRIPNRCAIDVRMENNLVTAANGSDQVMPTPGLCRVGWFLPLATGFLVFAHAA